MARRRCNQKIGENLRFSRNARIVRLSQRDIATFLGVHHTVVSRIESGQRPLGLDEAIVLVENAGFTFDQLTQGTPIDF